MFLSLTLSESKRDAFVRFNSFEANVENASSQRRGQDLSAIKF